MIIVPEGGGCWFVIFIMVPIYAVLAGMIYLVVWR